MKSLPLLVLIIACVKGQPVNPSKSQKSHGLRVEDYLNDISLNIKALRDKFRKAFEKDDNLGEIDIDHLRPDINLINKNLVDEIHNKKTLKKDNILNEIDVNHLPPDINASIEIFGVEKRNNYNENKKSIEEINLSHGILSDMKFREGGKREAAEVWKDSFGKPHIPYVINTNGGEDFSQEINNAINAMNSYMSACGQKVWVPRTHEEDYVEITTSQNGCWADVGKVGGKQQLNIGKGCDYKGTILHEMLHVMGFDHEQNRCDRDQFVEIVWDNIEGINSDQFLINPNPPFYSSNYDIFSVMHYGLWSNNFNSLKEEKFKTIKVRSQFMKLAPRVEKAIGEINDMSKTDKEEVNVAYGCKAARCLVTCEGFNNCTGKVADEPNVFTDPPIREFQVTDETIVNTPIKAFEKADESFGNNEPSVKAFQVTDEQNVYTYPPKKAFEKADEPVADNGPSVKAFQVTDEPIANTHPQIKAFQVTDEQNVYTYSPKKAFENVDESKAFIGSSVFASQVADEPTVNTDPPVKAYERKREGLELAKELDNLLRRFKDYIGSNKNEP